MFTNTVLVCEALKALKAGEVDAYASDAIILRSLIEYGYKEDDPSGNPIPSSVVDLKKAGYFIWPEPPEEYISGGSEEYALAIYKNSNYQPKLKALINQVLSENKRVFDSEKRV